MSRYQKPGEFSQIDTDSYPIYSKFNLKHTIKWMFEMHEQEAIMSKDEMPHEGHEKHLCYLHGEGFLKDNIEEWKKLVSNGQYFCGGCGRVANSSENLCDPQKL